MLIADLILLYLIDDFRFGIIIVILSFSMGGDSCADDIHHIVCSDDETGQQPFTGRCAPNDDFTFFFLRVFQIIQIERVMIFENSGRFIKADAILLFVFHRFFRIPVEFKRFLFCHEESIAYRIRKK